MSSPGLELAQEATGFSEELGQWQTAEMKPRTGRLLWGQTCESHRPQDTPELLLWSKGIGTVLLCLRETEVTVPHLLHATTSIMLFIFSTVPTKVGPSRFL